MILIYNYYNFLVDYEKKADDEINYHDKKTLYTKYKFYNNYVLCIMNDR